MQSKQFDCILKEYAFVNNTWKNVHFKLIKNIENVKYLR